jgi:hypothetical protein
LRKGDGKIVAFALYASKSKKRRFIYFLIAAIPRGFGEWLGVGLAYLRFILMSGQLSPPLKNGG